MKVLIVEDSSAQADALEILLREAGHETVLARTGFEAGERTASWVPDVIVLDHHLPDRDGLSFLKQMRTWAGWHATVPVVITTAVGGDELDRLRDELPGLKAVLLAKPFDPKVLLELLGLLGMPGGGAT